MSDRCEYFRELMRDALTVPLSQEQARQVELHVATCAECRDYQEHLAADDRLLSAFARTMAPAVSGIESAVMDALGRETPAPSAASHIRFWNRGMRLAAAAVIACGFLVLVGHLLLPLGTSTVTLADTLETMRQSPWIHVVQTTGPGHAHRYEYWECFGARTLARKTPGGRITYENYGENAMYSYDRNSNKITVSFTTDSYMVRPLWNPLAALSEAIERTEAAGAEATRHVEIGDGVRVERIHVDYDSEAGRVSATYIRDLARNRLLREETIVLKDGRKQAYTTAYDYPEQGPEDIYALDVPRDASILDIRPEGPALDLVDVVQERFERGFGDHLAVVLESWVDQDGTSGPSEIGVLRQKGDLKRSDIYRAFDFKGRPDAPASLYPLVRDVWPDLTIRQVLEIADANALEMRMLFDGQRTIRWRQDGGQVIRDEHGTDQFKMPQGPVPHSLAGLIWPNLHLRLQSGSSQFKREVRLLPEDPNRRGLVGLQFVEFAAREDYWFDPGEDYMQIERIRRQEGRGVISRSVVVQAAQTPQGRWYPQVIQTQFSSLNHADPTVSRRELRILVDANPTFGDEVFLADVRETAETLNSDAPSTETEPVSQEQAGGRPARGVRGTSPADVWFSECPRLPAGSGLRTRSRCSL